MKHYDKLEIVRAYDPAIDLEATGALAGTANWQEFIATRDPNLLTFVEGETPVRFFTRTLTLKERRDLRHKTTVSDQCERAFALCVLRVENLPFPDGSRRSWSRQNPNKPISDDELEELFSEDDVQHVGNVVWHHSFFARDRPRYVPVRVTCQDAMIAAALAWRRRHAAQTKAQDAPPSDDGRQPPEAPPPATPRS